MQASLTHIHERIARAAAISGRTGADIRLIGVSKTHPAEAIVQAHQLGVRDFGENRVQEAEAKIMQLSHDYPAICWHLIGHLQRNKAKRAAALFDYVHSVDSLAIAEALSRYRIETGKAPLRILLQCNVSGEESKEGFAATNWRHDVRIWDELRTTAIAIAELPGIEIHGLMTIAPYSEDAEATRPVFHTLRELREALHREIPHQPFHELSMGMSGDVEVAITEGATMVRVGRALFGERDYASPQGGQGV